MPRNTDELISLHRSRQEAELGPRPPQGFRNPRPEEPVAAEEFLTHLDLDTPAIRSVLQEMFPYLERNRHLKADVHARLKALAWMDLKGHNNVHAGHRALVANGVWRRLGCSKAPTYEKLREFRHDRLTPQRQERLEAALLLEAKRLHPELGKEQAEDATPLVGLRDDRELPYNGHYKTRMMKAELRFDVQAQALLGTCFYHGNASEQELLVPQTKNATKRGLHPEKLVVDGGYTSLHNIAWHWRCGVDLVFRKQEGWSLDVEAAKQDVKKRYQRHRRHAGFQAGADEAAVMRFLVDHGSVQDVEAVGRLIRNRAIQDENEDRQALRQRARNINESLNQALKDLPIRPERRGVRALLRRKLSCALTMFLVQLTRLQNGIRTSLCRVSCIA